MRKLPLLLILFLALFSITSCEEDEETEEPDISEGLDITTLRYILTPADSTQAVTFSYTDLDGPGGTPPEIDEGSLQPNTVYQGTVQVLNQLEQPAEDVTTKVVNQSTDHQFFYQSAIDDVEIIYNDADSDGNPLGVSTRLTTASSASGKLTITLQRNPDKDAPGVSQGELTNAGGETEINVSFDVEVR